MLNDQRIIKKNVAGIKQAQTGKAKVGPDFELSSAAEDDGMDDLIAQATQQNKQAQIQDVGQAQQQDAGQQQMTQQQEAQKNKAVMAKETLSTQTEELLQKFEQNMDGLDLQRNQAEIEQLLFGMRLQNTQYIDSLLLEGTKQRLNDRATFAEAMMASSLQDEMTLLKGNLEFRQLMFADNLMNQGLMARDDREFTRRLGEIDIETALQVAMADAEARSEAMKFGAISDMVKAAGTYAADRWASSKKETK